VASSVIGDWVVKISVDGGGFTSGVSTVATSAATANDTIAVQASAITESLSDIRESAAATEDAVSSVKLEPDIAAAQAKVPEIDHAKLVESNQAVAKSMDNVAFAFKATVIAMNAYKIGSLIASGSLTAASAMDLLKNKAAMAGNAVRSMGTWMANAGRSAIANAGPAFRAMGQSISAAGSAALQALPSMWSLAAAAWAAMAPLLPYIVAIAAVIVALKALGAFYTLVTTPADTDNLSGEDYARVEAANKSLKETKEAFGALFSDVSSRISVVLAPGIEAASNFAYAIIEAYQPVTQVLQRLMMVIFEIGVGFFTFVIDAMSGLMPIINAGAVIAEAWLDVIATGIEAWSGAMGEMAKNISWSKEFLEILTLIEEAAKTFAGWIKASIPVIATFFQTAARQLFATASVLATVMSHAAKLATFIIPFGAFGAGQVAASNLAAFGDELWRISQMELTNDKERRMMNAPIEGYSKAVKEARRLREEHEKSSAELFNQIALHETLSAISAGGGANATSISLAHYERVFEHENKLAELRSFGLDRDNKEYRRLEEEFRINEAYRMRLDMMKEAAELNQKYRDPAEIFRTEMARIQQLQELEGPGALTRDAAGRAALDALAQFERAAGTDRKVQLTSGLTSGSVEALSALNKARFAELQSGQRNPQERIEAALEANRVQQQRAADAGVNLLEFFRAAENN